MDGLPSQLDFLEEQNNENSELTLVGDSFNRACHRH